MTKWWKKSVLWQCRARHKTFFWNINLIHDGQIWCINCHFLRRNIMDQIPYFVNINLNSLGRGINEIHANCCHKYQFRVDMIFQSRLSLDRFWKWKNPLYKIIFIVYQVCQTKTNYKRFKKIKLSYISLNWHHAATN